MDHFKTQYEQLYDSEEYYWGLEPADFLDRLIELSGGREGTRKVLDIGCGEGKDAVYMAQNGFEVTAFDITESGICKTKKLAADRKVDIRAFVADINDFDFNEQFDIIYSTGTIQYLREEGKAPFFEKIRRMTKPNGLVFFNVFVEKPYLELPPDWDREEKMWKTGELFLPFADWKLHLVDEVTFEDFSNGIPHYHCMDRVLAQKIIT